MALGGKSPTSETTEDNPFKIRLVGSKTGYRVVFRVVPDFIENRNVNYKSLDPVHMPGNIQTFQSSSSRTFNISNIKIVSRTIAEATSNLQLLNTMRGWTMPHFGKDVSGGSETAFGAPPEVLYLSAFSDANSRGHIYKVPVIINQLSIPYPADVDYIATSTGEPFPTIMTVDMNLTETHSPTAYSNFDLAAYRKGDLTNF